MATPNETVEYQIIIEAQAAVKTLQELTANMTTFGAKTAATTEAVKLASKEWGLSLGNTKSLLQEYDKTLSTTGKDSAIFGELGNQGWKSVGESIDKSTAKAGGFHRSIDAIRIAMGTLIAMAVFQFFNLVTESFRKMIEGAKQVELALYQIANAERSLSEAGVNISPKDFDAMIKSLKELFPYLSKIDLSKMVAQIAVLTKDLGLTKDQLTGLIQAIPIMAQRGQITIEQATQQVVNGLANNGRGWKDLGIVVDAQIIKQEAVTAKIVESADAYDKLTAEQQKQVDVLALLSILNKSVSGEQQNQAEYQKTLAETSQQVSSSWEDFMTLVGTTFKPILIPALKMFNELIVVSNNNLQYMRDIFVTLAAIVGTFGIVVSQAMKGNIKSIQDLKETAITAFNSLRDAFNKNLFSQGLGSDTATVPTIKVPVEIDTTKAQQELKDLDKDLLKMKEQEDKLNREFDTKQSRELQDHTTSMARDEQDYQIKRSRFIQDANQAINQKNKEYHQKELDDEAKFQEQLRQLREHFLYDLEDALRDRDAKQVLRLMEKYQMDKTDLINEHNLQQKADAQKHADDIAQAKADEADKLKQMDEDHKLEMQRKEEDYKLKRQRELEDHQQELKDLAAQREARLREAAQAIADELGIKGDGVKRIYDMLNDFYGPNGAFDKLYDYTNDSMLSKAEQMLAQVMALYGQATQAANQAISAIGGGQTGGGRTDTSNQGQTNRQGKAHTGGGKSGIVKPQAQGGSYLALGPTKTTFGEAGPELATFIPLGHSLPVNNGGLGGSGVSGGKVQIELWLSPDLENRIMTNTLDAAADVVIRTTNSK